MCIGMYKMNGKKELHQTVRCFPVRVFIIEEMLDMTDHPVWRHTIETEVKLLTESSKKATVEIRFDSL